MSTDTQTQRIVERSPMVGVFGWFFAGIGVAIAAVGLAIAEPALPVVAALMVVFGLAFRRIAGITTISPDGFELALPPFVRKRVSWAEVEDFWFVERIGFIDSGGIGWRIPRRGVRVLIMNDGPGVGMRLTNGLELRIAGPGGLALYERLRTRFP